MPTWKHVEWETFKGTWLIVSGKMNDDEIVALIESNPDKYGSIESWKKEK